MVIEPSGVHFWLKSYTLFQNHMNVQRKVDLKSQVWFQTKIAWHKLQLLLNYIYFEIAQIQDLISSNILLMQYWASLKLNSSIFWEEKMSFGNKSCKICHVKGMKGSSWKSPKGKPPLHYIVVIFFFQITKHFEK